MKLIQLASSAVFALVSAVGIVWLVKYHHSKQHNTHSPKTAFGRELRETEFCIDTTVCPCNNGSFGAVPRKVLQQQQRFIEQRESNPELWYRRQYSPCYFPSDGGYNLYTQAVTAVANFVGAAPQDLVLVENTTTAINAVLKNLPLGKGDKILLTSHTYGAVLKTAQAVCEEKDCEVVIVEIPLPIISDDDIISVYSEALDQHSDIKIAVIDHITSPSAILMPLEKLTACCHAKRVLVLADGAHAPGQLALDLGKLRVDFYCGNLHKWLFSPRGCALLWAHPNHHDIVRHVITSHHVYKATLMERFCFIGTRDNIPYYTTSVAIKFHNDLGGLEHINPYNSSLTEWAADMLAKAWKTDRLAIPSHMRAPFMAVIAIPETGIYPVAVESCSKLMADVYQKSSVFAAFSYFNQRLWCRISGHVYNCKEDYYQLRDAVLQVTQL